MIYLDSPAVVKLAHAEPESTALRSWLGERAETQWISSVLTEIESFRALARYAPEAAHGWWCGARFRCGADLAGGEVAKATILANAMEGSHRGARSTQPTGY